jgi:Tfp pilus assembly protein PilO
MTLADLIKRFDFNKLSMRERILFTLTTAAVLFVLIVYLLVPMVRSAKDLTAQKVSLKTEIDQGMTGIPRLRNRAEELRQASRAEGVGAVTSGKSDALFPRGSRLSALLEEMTRLARIRQIEIVSVRPEAIEDKGTYLQLTLQIDVQSRFRELADYLLMVENLPRAVVVRDLKVETRTDLSPAVLGHLKTVTYLGKE